MPCIITNRQLPALLLILALAVGWVPALAAEAPPAQEIVQFNAKTHKYHCPTCIWARRCTVNCVPLPKAEAIRRGGVPCKVCGGSCAGGWRR